MSNRHARRALAAAQRKMLRVAPAVKAAAEAIKKVQIAQEEFGRIQHMVNLAGQALNVQNSLLAEHVSTQPISPADPLPGQTVSYDPSPEWLQRRDELKSTRDGLTETFVECREAFVAASLDVYDALAAIDEPDLIARVPAVKLVN